MATKVFVAGASGDVGSEVVRALRARDIPVRALVRKNRVPGAEEVVGDLADRAAIDRALDGCDAAVFITPHHTDEERLGHNVIDAAEAARIRRLVYISAYHPLSRMPVLQRLLDGVGLIGPHYKAKLRVERRVRATGSLSPVVLCPTNFYQNDEDCLPEILAGAYPQAIGHKRLNRVDTRDVGDAAALALTSDLAPGAYPVVGPDAWTGDTCARVWSEALGTPVGYAGDDIARWSRTVGTRMPAAKAHDFVKTLRIIQRFGCPVSAATIARTTALLGRPPRDYRSYARERAATIAAHPVSSRAAG